MPTIGGGAHSPAAKGVGESQFRRQEKKRSTLPTLWFVWTRFKNVELSHERTREKRRCYFCTKHLWGARNGSLKQKYSRLSEVSQLRYRPARLHRLGGTQPCLKLRLQVSVVCFRALCLICIWGSSILGLLKRLQIRAQGLAANTVFTRIVRF